MTCDRAMPAAVLWDLDGTIVDSEGAWFDAANEVLAGAGLAPLPDADRTALRGAALPDAAAVLQGRGAAGAVGQIVDAMTASVLTSLDRDGIAWRPGARELILRLAREGVPQALVTMSPASVAHRITRELEGAPFATIVTADDVELGKPDPEPYLRAIESLGVEGAQACAVEDSATGIASAHAAGAWTVAVIDAAEPDYRTVAHETWTTLQGRSPSDLTPRWCRVQRAAATNLTMEAS